MEDHMKTKTDVTRYPEVAIPSFVIEDEALRKLKYENIENYLVSTGWTMFGSTSRDRIGLYQHPGMNSIVAVRRANKADTRLQSMRCMLSVVPVLEERSPLEVYLDILNGVGGPDGDRIRTVAIVSGQVLEDIRQIFNVNMDGLEMCRDCDPERDCADCPECEGDSCAGFDCEEIRRTSDILEYISTKSHIPAA